VAFFRLVVRNLLRHWVRSLLTVGSLTIALFLLCTLRSLLTTLEAGTKGASARRLIVQSAVSLFVDLPLSYQRKIDAVPGVEISSKWHWLGCYYQDESNQFGQFGCDPERIFEIYPELEVVEGSPEAFAANRRGCVVADDLARRFGWKLGNTVPLIGMIYPHPDGPDVPWEFEVAAIYHPTSSNYASMFLFQWEYFEKTMETSPVGTPGPGTYVVRVGEGVEPTAVMGAIDQLFENGPQRVQATPESEFLLQFVTMFGNVPFFISTIGFTIVVAILLACVNTMLMAAREQRVDVGILKALGFTDRRMVLLLGAQSLALCSLGGGLGVALAIATQSGIGDAVATFWPGYEVESSTIAVGVAVTLGIGVLAGVAPAWQANRLRCVEALRAT